MKKTKIVATMSDFRCTEEFVKQLFDAGMDVVRVNSAHVSEDGATHIVETVHRVNPAIPIMIDTKGPEIRVTTIADEYGNSIIQLNENLKSQRSIHVIAGGDYTFRASGRNFKLSADMYYKKLDDLNPYTVDNVKIRYYGENCAKGHAMGLDVKFFGEFVPGTDSWISFSLMKAEQSIRGSKYVPMPNSQGYNVSVFFQDYFPGYKRVKLNLKGVLSGGLPVTAPRTGYEDGYFRTPAYKRVDLGFSYQLAGGTDAIMDRGFFRNLKNIWLGLDVFNLFDIKNTSSYYWITNIDNHQYAIPNYLTGRQLNVRLIVDF